MAVEGKTIRLIRVYAYNHYEIERTDKLNFGGLVLEHSDPRPRDSESRKAHPSDSKNKKKRRDQKTNIISSDGIRDVDVQGKSDQRGEGDVPTDVCEQDASFLPPKGGGSNPTTRTDFKRKINRKNQISTEQNNDHASGSNIKTLKDV